MQLSYATIQAILTRQLDERGKPLDTCHQYGEPGYRFDVAEPDTPLLVLSDFWCQCGKNPNVGKHPGRDDKPEDLHDIGSHHSRVWRQMESQGVEWLWYDEWIVDYECDKAFRTTSDSYFWQPSLVITEGGDYLTPDNDIDAWIEWAIDEVKAIPDNVWSHADIREAGFEKLNEHSYESGWHPHQTDDPVKILAEMRVQYPDDELIFTWDEQSQFYARFSIWRRPVDQEVEA